MFGIKYFKADSSTYVIKSAGGRTKKQGKGLSFFYNAATSSVAVVPVNAQEAPFIFSLQTSDYQQVKVQGQITYRISDPEKITEVLNFNLKKGGQTYISEDPTKLNDRVVRTVQAIVQRSVQTVELRESLMLNQGLANLVISEINGQAVTNTMGLEIVDVTISNIAPTPETIRALEAEAREVILQKADDAVYVRRKASVEQERVIKDAELKTELFVQQKEQEIAESSVANERAILRGKAQTEKEGLDAQIEAETQRKDLVLLNSENEKQEADTEAYGISARMNAFKTLPVENLKAMALANMDPDQLMAMAFESLAQNADKIGELNIGPDTMGQMMKKAARR